MKNINKQTIVISIILLLVGVSVSSAISVDTKSTISNNQNDGCRECNEVSDADLIRVERLLDRVEVYSKLLLVLSRHNPELVEDYEELTDMISTLNTLDLTDVICDKLLNLIFYIIDKSDYFEKLIAYYYKENMLIRRIIAFYLFVLCGDLYLYLSQLYYFCM